MYLSKINHLQSASLPAVYTTSTREFGHQLLVKCSTLAENQAITITGLQWLSSKVILLWVIYLSSLQKLLGTSGGEMTCKVTGRQRKSARVWRFHAFTWESLNDQKLCWQLCPFPRIVSYWLLWSLHSHHWYNIMVQVACISTRSGEGGQCSNTHKLSQDLWSHQVKLHHKALAFGMECTQFLFCHW